MDKPESTDNQPSQLLTLPQEQAHLRSFADTVPAIVFGLDIEGYIQFFNRRWLEYTGLPPERATNSWKDVIHPDDMAEVTTIWNKSFTSGHGHTWECRIRRSDGIYRWHLARIECIRDTAGHIIQWFGLASDIDDQKKVAKLLEEKMEEQTQELEKVLDDKTEIEQKLVDTQHLFSSFMEYSPAYQWIKDTSGKLVFMNRQVAELYQVNLQDVIGKHSNEWLPAECARLMQEIDYTVVSTGEIWESVVQMAVPGKPDHYFLMVKFPIKTAYGAIQFIGGIALDITASKEYEAKIEELNRKLEQGITQLADANQRLQIAHNRALEASELKSAFVANISHEIRTPLSGVIGMAELLLQREELDTDSRELAQDIFNCANSLLDIVNDLLDFSKLEAGRMDLHHSIFSVKSLGEEVLKAITLAATQKGLDIRLSVDPQIPAHTAGDASRLRQVLLNFLHNALKFTDQGSIELFIWLESQEDGQARVRFEVKDTGIGIPKSAQKRLFEPFVQADSSTTRKFGGTGLGLSICKRLVALMSGDIGFSSQENRGSTFWCSVPLQLNDVSVASHGLS